VARLILDTGVIVAAVRGRVDLAAFADQDDVILPAVAVAEYLTGVELDPEPTRRAVQQAFLDELLGVLPVANYDRAVAVHHAALLAHVRRSGRARGAHDLIIAATARATARTLVSTDARAGFDDLPDVQFQLIPV
jgi:tRNA(fMet)-specific endonuclease VapC